MHSTDSNIRSEELLRFILTGTRESEPKFLITYENIILVRSSDCHSGFGRCSSIGSDPEHYN
jgi:hypothetical protein